MMTVSTPRMSRPRAATSVANRKATSPCRHSGVVAEGRGERSTEVDQGWQPDAAARMHSLEHGGFAPRQGAPCIRHLANKDGGPPCNLWADYSALLKRSFSVAKALLALARKHAKQTMGLRRRDREERPAHLAEALERLEARRLRHVAVQLSRGRQAGQAKQHLQPAAQEVGRGQATVAGMQTGPAQHARPHPQPASDRRRSSTGTAPAPGGHAALPCAVPACLHGQPRPPVRPLLGLGKDDGAPLPERLAAQRQQRGLLLRRRAALEPHNLLRELTRRRRCRIRRQPALASMARGAWGVRQQQPSLPHTSQNGPCIQSRRTLAQRHHIAPLLRAWQPMHSSSTRARFNSSGSPLTARGA